jgi:alanine racemase
MTIAHNKLRIRVHLGHIADNYLLLRQAGGPGAIPVIKSDAYGHGLGAVARTLTQAGANTMAVGTVDEAVWLWQLPFAERVISLLGPQDQNEARAVWEHGLLPVVYRLDQLELLAEAAGNSTTPLGVALKFDTGMCRLGFTESEVEDLLHFLAKAGMLSVEMAMSHLASADDPEEREFNLEQARRFTAILSRLREAGHQPEASLVNSAGILAYPDLCLDAPRPGIALYGANPFHATSLEHLGRGLAPAMEAWAPVLQLRNLKQGDTVGYGRTFTASREMRIAVVAVGYADAYSRGLSGQGSMLLHGERAPILGRVCMQLTAVDVTEIPETKPGDPAYLLGGEGEHAIRPEELAAWWGTIPYEVFCLLGLNQKEYGEG